MSGYLAKRCPKCGDQLPAYFEKCKYCGADLSAVEPSEYEPLDMTPVEVKPKRRRGVPRIKKWKGYEKFVVDATPEDDTLSQELIKNASIESDKLKSKEVT